MPFTFGIVEDDELPVAKRERKSSYTEEDIALGRSALEAIARLGRHESYSAARNAHAVLSDGQSYVKREECSNAASRTVALLRYIVGPEWREATIHQQVGRKSDNGFGWAIYLGPYEAPKPRNRQPKAAPAEAPAKAPAKA